MNQLFYGIDMIILSNFGFSKPIASFQTCISMTSLRHQRAAIRLWSANDVSRLRDFAGYVVNIHLFPFFNSANVQILLDEKAV